MLHQSIAHWVTTARSFINPKYEQIDGCRSYRSLQDLPHAPVCVALAIADAAVPAALTGQRKPEQAPPVVPMALTLDET
jgi:hypothetical protein